MPAQRRNGDRRRDRQERRVIGWREWVGLPALGIERIKAKVDTGARSSSLHAFDVEYFERDGKPWVRFKVHPMQRDARTTVIAEAEIAGKRKVRSSSGHETLRPVIRTTVDVDGRPWPVEITLARRDTMGFRMLLGRSAVRGRFVVDPGRSFLGARNISVKQRTGRSKE